jgi:hypothetical protein
MESEAESRKGQPYVSSSAIALSLVGGTIILIGSLMPWLFIVNYNHQMPSGGMMGSRGMMMGGFGTGFMGVWSFFWSIVLISGIMVIIGGIMASKRPQEATIWGSIVLAFSVLALAGMGFSILGSILGIIGGITMLSTSKRI